MKKTFTIAVSIFIVFAFTSYSQQIRITPTKTITPVAFDKTPPLRSMKIVPAGTSKGEEEEHEVPNQFNVKKVQEHLQDKVSTVDPAIQSKIGELNTISGPIANWEGINNINGYYPPDTDGDISPDYYIQMVNVSFQIWDRAGNSLYGPVDNKTLWDAPPTEPWTNSNDGDPVVLYDRTADRWIFTQFALPNYPAGPYYETIAISETGDPLGSYYRYGFEFSDLPDYPKFGIWPDGYYMTVNQFSYYSPGQYFNWVGEGVAVFERNEMLNGNPSAGMVFFNLTTTDDLYSALPSNFDGPPPPAGTPNYLVYMNDDAWTFKGSSYPYDQLRVLECHVDWTTTTNSTLTGPTILNTNSFNSQFLGAGRSNIVQPGTTRGLDAVSDRILYRLQYRNFGTYQTLVTDHSVNVATNQAGIRWYELRNSGSGWSIYQQGTYAPTTDNRWMGSIAMDGGGNLALGYSVSSSTVYPTIKYVGRYKNDPLGQMTTTEKTIIDGTGSQTGTAYRWGDYSTMSIDPVDDATFWFTSEYVQTTGNVTWQTRIASFTLGFDLSIKVFLEGTYAGIFSGSGTMNTYLNSAGYLPTLQPFNSSPLTYSGVEKVRSSFFSTHTNIVDWVFVELRTGTSASTIVAQRAGLLKSNGTIVGLDGVSPLRFGLPAGDYYIVIRHRNHIAIMSSTAVTMSSNPTINSYDFTTAQTFAYGTNAMADLGDGNFGMIAGDGNGNGQIQNNDSEDFWKPKNGILGYENADYNMNGQVQNNDNEDFWKPNNGRGSQVP